MNKELTGKEIVDFIMEHKLDNAIFGGYYDYGDYFALELVIEGTDDEPIKKLIYYYYYEGRKVEILLVDYSKVDWDSVDSDGDDVIDTYITKEEAFKVRGLG